MADDVFNVTNIESAVEAMKGMQNTATKTKEQIQDIDVSMRAFAEASAKLPEVALLDPKRARDMKEQLMDLRKELVRKGKTIQEINEGVRNLIKLRRQERELVGRELIDMSRLTIEARKRIKEEKRKLDFGEKYVQLGNKQIKLQAGEVRSSKETLKAFGEKGKRLANYASSMSNIQLSLAGIIALVLELWNIERKAGAMAKQITVQWEKSSDNMKVASQEMSAIRYQFHKAWEVAGQYEISLARAGFEKENLARLSRKMYATELLYGRAVQQQKDDIKGLVANFGLLDVEADSYLDTVREVSKTIPMLSMDEAVDDWETLINETKVFNTDLLGTLALYNTLMRKDLAKELGLGDAPRVVRREIVQTVAGFSKDLSDGWKAALGKGTTAAVKMLEFESLPIEQRFLRMAEFVEEQTKAYTGAERQVRARKMLMQMNFSKESAIELARSFAKGGFDPKAIAKLATTMEEQRKSMKEIEEKARANRENILQEGLNLAYGLTDAITLLRDWIESELLPVFREIRTYLRKLLEKEIPEKELKSLDESLKKSGITGAISETLTKRGRETLQRKISETPVFERFLRQTSKELPEAPTLAAYKKDPESYKSLQLRRAAMQKFLMAAQKGAVISTGSREAFIDAISAMGTGAADSAIQQMTIWAQQGARNSRAVKRPGEGNSGHTTRRPKDKHFKFVIRG